MTLSVVAAIWAAGCSDDDDKIPENCTGGGADNLGGSKATGGSGATANGGTTPQVTGGTANGTTTTSPSTVPQAGSTPNAAGVGNTPTVGGSGTTPVGGGTSTGGTTGTVTGGTNGGGTGPVAGATSTTGVCPTTPGSFTPVNAVFSAGSVLPVEGFKKAGAALNNNPAADAQIVTTPELCNAGCLKMSGTFVSGDGAYSKTVSIERLLAGAEQNLVGAKVVMRIAVDNPSNIPIFLGMFAPGGTPAAWGASSGLNATTIATNYAVANGFSEFVWNVADMKDYQQRQFCAASATSIGLMLQTQTAVPATVTTPVAVNVYIQSIEIRPAGYVPTGTGGATGTAGAAGAAGAAGSGG